MLEAALADPELKAAARDWPKSHDRTNNRYTNLLFYEDPDFGFVINGLVKDETGRTPVHDHGHAWGAYGLLEGDETDLRYWDPDGSASGSEPDEEISLTAGEVDLVPPWTFPRRAGRNRAHGGCHGPQHAGRQVRPPPPQPRHRRDLRPPRPPPDPLRPLIHRSADSPGTCQTNRVLTVEGLFSPDGLSLGDRICSELQSFKWNSILVAAAFVKRSGISRLYEPLDQFGSTQHGSMCFSIGIDHGGSSIEAVDALYTLLTKHGGQLWIVHNPQGNPSPTYHPKMWLFSSSTSEHLLLVGSGNITRGGLYTNYEASIAIGTETGEQVILEAQNFFTRMTDESQPDVRQATPELLQDLHDAGHLPSEHELRRITTAANSLRRSDLQHKSTVPIFRGCQLPGSSSPPATGLPTSSIQIRRPSSMAPGITTLPPTDVLSEPLEQRDSATGPQHRYFYITVRMRNKTEVFLAKKPLDEDPAFFGAPFRGHTTPHGRGDPQPQAEPLPIVRIELHSDPPTIIDDHPLKMWTYTHGASANSDFRTNFTAPLQKKIPEDSVVRFERDPVGSSHLQFAIDIFPPSHSEYQEMLSKCDTLLTNSPRRYGWD